MVGVSLPHPLGRFSMLDLSTVEMLPVPENIDVGSMSPRAFEDVSFGVGTLLAVEQIEL